MVGLPFQGGVFFQVFEDGVAPFDHDEAVKLAWRPDFAKGSELQFGS